MDPNQPPATGSSSDPVFIPPVANRKAPGIMSPKKMIIAIVALSLAVILGVGMLLMSRTTDPVDDVATLNAQMQNLVTISTQARKSARNADVAKASIDAATLLIGDTSNLATVTKGVKVKASITASVKSEYDPIIKDIKSASIDGRFDRVFVPIFIDKVESVQRQAKIVHGKTAQPALKAAVSTTYDHLTAILATFKAIDVDSL
jgi:hypothetical protein